MKLNLKRPLVFFDIESTGLNIAKDRIVEISYLKVYPNQTRESKTMRLNPECPISTEATAVHHITNDDVKDCPTFRQVAHELASVFQGCDIAGYNSNRFDIPLLAEEFERTETDFDLKRCQPIDVQTIFHRMEQRTLTAAYRFYCNKDLEGAHAAAADTEATYEVLCAQLEHYGDALPNDVEALSVFTSQTRNVDYAGFIVLNEVDKPVFGFGKYKGRLVTEVLNEAPGYLSWILNADFPLYTKRKFKEIRLKSTTKK
ncbi:MAG: 3'-5' exonuclease [Bacteroidales bacterium]|nr:3'-5' exonuclease [Bacteroidales bacterium]